MSAGSELDEQSQRELAKFLENENAKLRLQNSIHTFTDMCWDKCITKVGNRLERNDETCLTNCVERFLDTSLFIVRRLEEMRNQI
ncbi:uncharacterized protein VTP21DRAFT_9510 [Calcarisporiella thermophila]|uniref:uncharacterized protein n=1 Tax=Calcarisporiella thermophila TaxID=911321 RepID=UPI00374201C5